VCFKVLKSSFKKNNGGKYLTATDWAKAVEPIPRAVPPHATSSDSMEGEKSRFGTFDARFQKMPIGNVTRGEKPQTRRPVAKTETADRAVTAPRTYERERERERGSRVGVDMAILTRQVRGVHRTKNH